MKRILYILAALVCAMACNRSYVLELPLAVDQTTLKFSKESGATHILVYSTEKWTAILDENVSWASIEQGAGTGNGEFVFSYEANPMIERQTGVKIKSPSGEIVITMIQSGTIDEASLVLAENDLTVPTWSTTPSVAFVSNNLEEVMEYVTSEVTYPEEDSPWISNVTITAEGLSFTSSENTSGAVRSATLSLVLKDSGKQLASLTVTQGAQVTFDTLRNKLTEAGTVTLGHEFISGEVISDYGNENMEINPHLTWKTVDYAVNASTAYVQSSDGRYGLRIQATAAKQIEKLKRFSKVTLSLNGLTLTREDNPVRYTISGLTAESIIEVTESTGLTTSKSKTIAELGDDDIYTFVTLEDVEFAYNFGSYGNMHDGFVKKTATVTVGHASDTRNDYVLRKLRDKSGDVMSMIIAGQAPWRRSGSRVPQGSGTVGGIVVSSTLGHYPGGDYGKYQLRPLGLSDFNIKETEGFSRKLFDFYWTEENYWIKGGSNNESKAKEGDCTMYASNSSDGGGRTTSFSGSNFASQSGSWAGRYKGSWKKDEYITLSFSTKGIAGKSNLSLIFTAATGDQNNTTMYAPLYWDLEYSTDGTTFTSLKEDIVIYPAPVFAYECMDLPAGITEYIFRLPDSLAGQDNVIIRLKAAGNVCYDKTKGFGQGTTPDSPGACYLRFEEITVKYNEQ